jgi:N-acetylglucosaminyldiphosphoundecaprenol N-acetyl-beta-D-mannosaminyltransferase
VPTAIASEHDLILSMIEDCRSFRAGTLPGAISVLDTNGQAVSLYARDPAFARTLETASIVHADGQFIVTLSRFCGRERIPERTATTDFIHAAAAAAEARGLTFYLLGGTPEVNRASEAALGRLYPRLRIVGRRHGYFAEDEVGGILADINTCRPDVLWVGLGKPKEQFFVSENRHRLACAWVVTCGGCYNFLTGGYARAPRWMQVAGLEWVHRMFSGPRHLVRRYLTTTPHALWLSLYWLAVGRDRGALLTLTREER